MVLPGYDVYSKMRKYSLGFNIDYRLLDRDFSPVVGTDVYVHYFEFSYYTYVPGLLDREVVNASKIVFGIIPRIGLTYTVTDNIVVEGGLGRPLNIDPDFHPLHFWKIYTGVVYYFDTF